MIPPNLTWLQMFRRTTSSGQYLAEIDGLRFLAIVPVLVQHLSERLLRYTSLDATGWSAHEYSVFLASRGTIGVFLFFAISGFILALPFVKYWSAPTHGTLDLKSYFLRRVTRLEPPYIIWMSLFFIVLLIKGTYSFTTLFPHYIASLFYIHNIIYNDYSWINPVAWSLEVEIQFYLLAPLLTALFFSIRHKIIRRAVLFFTLILIITLQQILPLHELPWKATLAGQLQHFLVGFLLADFYYFDWKNKNISTYYFWDVIALLAMLVLPFTWSGEYVKNILFTTALLFLLIAAFKGRFFKKFLQLPVIAIIGGMCYTIYLIHLPLLELFVRFTSLLHFTPYHLPNLLLQILLTFPIIIFLSAWFFRWLEKPFMQKKWIQSISFHQIDFQNMKRFFSFKNGIFFFITFISIQLNAQSSSNSILIDGESMLVRPVEDLIAEALQKSPLLKIQDVKIQKRTDETKLVRRKWADYVQVNGSYQFGNSLILDAVQSNTGTTDAFSTDRTNVFYNVGAGIRVPIGDVWTRKVRMRVADQEVEIERLTRMELETQIREAVIRAYNELNTSLNVLQVKAKEIENRKLTLETAEQYFRDGTLPLADYNEAVARLATLEEAYERAKGDVMLHFWTLKELTGTNISE